MKKFNWLTMALMLLSSFICAQAGTAPSATNWFNMDEFGRTSNSEVECYVPSQNTIVSNALVQTAIVQNTTCNGKSSSYASGELYSKFSFTYGTVKYHAKFAGGTGTWPAIWLLGSNCQPKGSSVVSPGCPWPAAGSNEIDITEIKNGSFTQPWQNVINPSSSWYTCRPTVSDVTQNYHNYEFDWTASALTWKIDGVTTCTQTGSSYIPSTPMFLIINEALGGAGGGTINNGTLPQSNYVDSLTVTQNNAVVFSDFALGGSAAPTPEQASGFRAQVTGTTTTLTWSFSTPIQADVNAINIYRCTGTGCNPQGAQLLTTLSMTAAAPVTTFVDTTVATGNTYGYGVAASCPLTGVTCAGQGTLSNTAYAVVPAVVSPLAVVTTSLPAGTVGTAYSFNLVASGGVAPLAYSATGLATGLTISPTTGAITGTPTAAGTFTEAVTVTDSSTPALTALASFTVTVAPAAITPPPSTVNPVGVKFVGTGTAMAATESAGVVAITNWNQATGTTATALALKDSTGAATGATLSFTCTGWVLPITDAAGNVRLMRGYCDDSSAQAITATFSKLLPGTYNVYVYTDGDNAAATRTATYALSGTGVTAVSSTATDSPNTNFSGTFTSGKNYLLFTNVNITSGLTVTATPATASDGTKRAPLQAIELVPVNVTPPPPPPVAISISPTTASLAAGSGATQQFTATVTNTTNTAVNWTSSCAGPSSTGLFTAPGSTGTCTVTATSQADTTKSATATVTIIAPPPAITVTCTTATGEAVCTAILVNVPSGQAFTVMVTADGVSGSTTGVLP